MSWIPGFDAPFYSLAKGDVPGTSTMQIIGRINELDISDGERVISPQKALFDLPSTGANIHVVSDDAQDSASGTGLAQVEITYLDSSDWSLKVVTPFVNGTTEVDTGASAIRILLVRPILNGTSAGYNDNTPAGIVSILHGSGGPLMAQLTPESDPDGDNFSEMSQFTVPAGKILTFQHASVQIEGGNNEANLTLLSRQNDLAPASPYHPIVRVTASRQQRGTNDYIYFINTNYRFSERTDLAIGIQALVNKTSAVGTATFILEDA